MAQTVTMTGISNTPVVGALSVNVVTQSDFQELLFNTDLKNVFFNNSEFAENASYYHKTLGAWKTYSIIFDDPHTSFSFGNDAEYSTIKPQFQIQESALHHRILKNDKVKIRNKTYLVDEFVSDGVGVTTVFVRLK